ncbi:18299_t:CDS:2 [Rhizophagus irregularis]|nr:18299_t:CDS:2 [Rhizophagus irregularis]
MATGHTRLEGTASVSDSVLTTNLGIQFECTISDYIGALTSIEGMFYLELCNFSFIQKQSTPVLGKHEITIKKKFSDIASNPLIVTENSMEIFEETSEEQEE